MNEKHLVIVYRDFTKVNTSFSHVGLGVSAYHTQKVLQRCGVNVNVFGVVDCNAVDAVLHKHPKTTHCIIEAPVWVWGNKLEELMALYPGVHFVVRLHSQLSFLATEPSSITNLRHILDLSEFHNISLATNSKEVKHWVEESYLEDCTLLPNLYNLQEPKYGHHIVSRDILRVGSFGALRLLKNQATAAGAAMVLARRLGKELEFYVNINREEQGKEVLATLRNMFYDVSGMSLIEVPWAPWAEFRKIVAEMDLAFQVSHTETFNLVTADIVSEGVPSVVSGAVSWAPYSWMAGPDQIDRMVQVGEHLLRNRKEESVLGQLALEGYVEDSVFKWLEFLNNS